MNVGISLLGLNVCIMGEVKPYEMFLLPLFALKPGVHKIREWSAVCYWTYIQNREIISSKTEAWQTLANCDLYPFLPFQFSS